MEENHTINTSHRHALTQISTLGPSYSFPSNNSGAAYGGLPQCVRSSIPGLYILLKPKSSEKPREHTVDIITKYYCIVRIMLDKPFVILVVTFGRRVLAKDAEPSLPCIWPTPYAAVLNSLYSGQGCLWQFPHAVNFWPCGRVDWRAMRQILL